MTKRNQAYLLFIAASVIMTTTTGCSSSSTNTSNSINTSIDKNTQNVTKSINSTTSQDKGSDHLSLNIGSGCIGCGHCIRFDPEHFSNQSGNRIPDVTSQQNLSSSSLRMAIKNCPVKVIALK